MSWYKYCQNPVSLRRMVFITQPGTGNIPCTRILERRIFVIADYLIRGLPKALGCQSSLEQNQ